MTIPKPPPAPGRRRQLALFAATAVWRMLRPGRALATAQGLAGFPAHHPESLRKKLPRRRERWLAALDRQLWPEGEYTDITRAYRDLPGKSQDGGPS